MDGNFLCAADVGHIVVWDSRTGRHVRDIPIAPHYIAPREDSQEAADRSLLVPLFGCFSRNIRIF